MTNNDVFRRIHKLFKISDSRMIELFRLADYDVEKEEIASWLRQEEDPLLVEITDRQLAIFLNGFIIEKRGKREGPTPEPEDPLSNNMILRKLKIALNLRSEDIIAMFDIIGKRLTKNELSAFFRNPNHKSYCECMDQYLRNFLTGLEKSYK